MYENGRFYVNPQEHATPCLPPVQPRLSSGLSPAGSSAPCACSGPLRGRPPSPAGRPPPAAHGPQPPPASAAYAPPLSPSSTPRMRSAGPPGPAGARPPPAPLRWRLQTHTVRPSRAPSPEFD
eukprot:scaffold661973_cov38-Prasinocladus_malaysianus.AAC.1